MLQYNPYYFFLLMFDYDFEDEDKLLRLNKQLGLLESTLAIYFQSMIDINFNRMFNHFEIEFSTIKRNLMELKRINKFDSETIKLIDENVTHIVKYIDEYNTTYRRPNYNSTKIDVDTLFNETGLDTSSFEVLNYLVQTSYGKSAIDTLNLLIELIHYNPNLDILTSIHNLLKYKDSNEVLSYITILYVEEMAKIEGNTELPQKLQEYYDAEDISVKTKLLKELHLMIIKKKLDDLYSYID